MPKQEGDYSIRAIPGAPGEQLSRLQIARPKPFMRTLGTILIERANNLARHSSTATRYSLSNWIAAERESEASAEKLDTVGVSYLIESESEA